MPVGSALVKARNVITTWTVVTAQMNKDAVSVNPETRDLVALSAIYFLTSQ